MRIIHLLGVKNEVIHMPGGRPKIVIDYIEVEKLSNIQCTQEEIASFLNISVRTLQRDAEFCRIYKKGMEFGKQSLRRMQWESAKNGNNTMLIWLGKQYLNQREPVTEVIIPTTEQDDEMKKYA
jgi:hypothetical protein